MAVRNGSRPVGPAGHQTTGGDGSHGSTDWALSAGGAGLGDQGRLPKAHAACTAPLQGQGQGRAEPSHPPRRAPTTERAAAAPESRGSLDRHLHAKLSRHAYPTSKQFLHACLP